MISGIEYTVLFIKNTKISFIEFIFILIKNINTSIFLIYFFSDEFSTPYHQTYSLKDRSYAYFLEGIGAKSHGPTIYTYISRGDNSQDGRFCTNLL
jgi:hypothetical protein